MRHFYKHIAIALLFAAPFTASAQSIDEVTASLLAQIAQLQAQLSGSGGASSQATQTRGGNCVSLSRSLSRGDAGTDVTELQRFLVDEDLLDGTSVTGTFGPRTEAAVKQWQADHGIDTTGTVGPKTRAAMADCGGISTQTTIATGNACPALPKPANCSNPVEVRQNGCTVGWQCSHTVLPEQTFNATPKAGPAPLVVRFSGVVTSASTGFCPGNFCAATIVFGDGKTGAVPLPNTAGASVAYDLSHTYPTAGNYTATLYQGAWSDSTPRVGNPIAISVTGTAPTNNTTNIQTPTLIPNPQNGAAPLSVTFIVTNLTKPDGYTIDFGDGTYGSLIVIGNTIGATHTYTSSGTFSAKLRLPSQSGTPCLSANCTVVAVSPVTVTGGVAQSAILSGSPTTGLAPLGVIFGVNAGNTSYPGGVMLDFGDGDTEIVCNPGQICAAKTITHRFESSGSFEVKLIAIGVNGNSVLRTTTVNVSTVVSTSLTATPNNGVVPLEVTFKGHGGNNIFPGGAIIKFGDDTQQEFCAPNVMCGEKTITHTYSYGNPYNAQLIGIGTTSSASTTIGSAAVTATGGPTRITMKNPTGSIKKGESVKLEWTVAGTKPTSGSISFDLYTKAGTRIGTILTITNFQSGNATWKVPSISDTGCSSSQPNGLCGVNIVPGEYTIMPTVSNASVDTIIPVSLEIKDGTILPSGFTLTISPNAAELNRDMQIRYRVANPPYNSAVALWLVKPTGERVGLIDSKLEADTELTTYPWKAGRTSSGFATTGPYHITAQVYTPFGGNINSTSSGVVYHASATSTVFTLKAQNSGSCIVLTRNLGPGDRDEDTDGEVSKLQTFLAENSEIYPEGTVSGFYGNATRRAVERFQAASGIRSSGSPETNGYGAVGPSTRAAIATKCGESSVAFRAEPAAGKAPLLVTFKARSEGVTSNYTIDFGDGETATMQGIACVTTPCDTQITHVYESSGTYIAKLTRTGNAQVIGTVKVDVTNSVVTPPAQCAAITRLLTAEDTDAKTGGDVSRLQTYLATNPVLYPEGLVTGFYGPATAQAIRRYQTQNNIPVTGNVGPQTLEMIRCDKTVPTGVFTATPDNGSAPLTVKFTTNVPVTSGSYRIEFGDGQRQWLTATSVTHTYTAGGTYTAELVNSIGNCFGLTGDALTICEIGATVSMGEISIAVGQGANALSVSAFPTTLDNGANLTINWTSTNAPTGSKVRLEIWPETSVPATGNNEQGIASNAFTLPVNGQYTWVVPPENAAVVVDGGFLSRLPAGNYRIVAKLYSGNSCWGFCAPGESRQIHATAQSGRITIQ